MLAGTRCFLAVTDGYSKRPCQDGLFAFDMVAALQMAKACVGEEQPQGLAWFLEARDEQNRVVLAVKLGNKVRNTAACVVEVGLGRDTKKGPGRRRGPSEYYEVDCSNSAARPQTRPAYGVPYCTSAVSVT